MFKWLFKKQPASSLEVRPSLDWLMRPVMADGIVVAQPLFPTQLTDADLTDIYMRMDAIMTTIEIPRCEGRLLPVRLFDDIDSLMSLVRHGPPPQLAEWENVIREFGAYYHLNEYGPITVELQYWQSAKKSAGLGD